MPNSHRLVLTLCCAVMGAAAHAQTVTGTLIVGAGPTAVAVNPVTNKIYVANSAGFGTVTVIDGATNSTTPVAVGDLPNSVAVNPVTNKIYVANQGNNNVTVIDGATNTTTPVIAGSRPISVAVNPVTNKIYVVNNGSRNVTVIDGTKNTVDATVAVGTNPFSVAVNSVTNKVYVTNNASVGSVTVIDGANNPTTVSVGSEPVSVAVNPVTNKVYVANNGSGSVTVIDGAFNDNLHTTTVGAGTQPQSVAVNPVTNKIYVANETSANVTVIDGAFNDNLHTTPVGVGPNPRSVAVNPVTNRIYVASPGFSADGRVNVIDGANNSVGTLNVGSGLSTVTVNPVTNKIYVTNFSSNNVTVIDGANNSRSSVSAGGLPNSVAANPVTNKIYVGNFQGGTVTVIDGASNVTATVTVGTGPSAVAVNPLTNKIYVPNSLSGNVTVIDGPSNAITTVKVGIGPSSVAVNPVTNKIYVPAAGFGGGSVTVIDGATNTTATVSAGSGPIAVAVNAVTNKIYVANRDGTVTVINGVTNSPATVNVGTDSSSVAVNPVTNTIYVANKGSNNVTVINGATDTVTATVAVGGVGSGPISIAVNAVTNQIYVANFNNNNLTVIEGTNNSVRDINVGANPISVAVNPVTNKIYVANENGTLLSVIDGATLSSGIAAVGFLPQFVAVNPVTNKIYVASQFDSSGSGVGAVTVITEQQVQAIPLTTLISPLAGNQTSSASPSFTFNAQSNFSPIHPTPASVFFQVDTWQGPWTAATGGANASPFTGTVAVALQPGFHILYAYAGDGQEATSVQAVSPLIGSLAAYGFLVTPPPVLSVTKTHAGNFAQGQQNATYAVTVSNAGAGPTSGMVTVNETVPAGLTFVSMTGAGWSCSTFSCNRSDALASGASYEQITVTVNVKANATSPQVNQVDAMGGKSAGASAFDSTTIAVSGTPALSITKTHSGNFTQGQVGGAYTVTVSNDGTSPTSGTVTVTETAPTGLTVTSMSGFGWTCNTATCTRSDALAGGSSYTFITVTVNVAGNAASPLLNQVSASGGGSATANASDSTIIIVSGTPALNITKTHSGNFTQGQVGAAYTVTVSNAGNVATSGTVTVTETAPTGLTVTAMSGTGWTCNTVTCTRGDALAGGSSYPAIAVTVNVAGNAASPLLNQVSASGGGSATANASDSTIIVSGSQPALNIAKTHAGNFNQGQQGATYTLTVSDNAGAATTSGTVSVTDTLPFGLSLVSMAGTGWSCASNLCTRSNALAGAASYPVITVTVNVSATATSPQVNQASVSGGGSATANVTDSTVININQPTLSVNRKVLNYGISGSLVTSPQTILVTITGGVNVAWTATSDHSNITANPAAGVGTGTFQISANSGSSGIVTVTSTGATNSPQSITVNVAGVTPAAPFGSFDTPATGASGVVGAIPVTGWVLDNIEVTHVDILREPVMGEPSGNLILIGSAVFVADARPDVQAMFPAFPFQYRAGWGYQMLTNFLPNAAGSGPSGNGTYKLHAIAFNKAGSQLDLGTKTITVDNAHATKPFGTIDTPGQGGTISGADSVNFGWALTPQPAMIALDGSTITVVLDGVSVGHPVYNQFRSDIANLFPGYANSGGAVGFFHVNTTTLANGVHTISWNAFDNLGRGEGLGSRYFNVLNTGGSAIASPEEIIDESVAREPDAVARDADGGYSVTMEEVGHIKLHLGAGSGNMLVQGEPQALPTGSTLKGGVFYWQPGPGFLGEYTMQFARPDGSKIPVRVSIVPKRY